MRRQQLRAGEGGYDNTTRAGPSRAVARYPESAPEPRRCRDIRPRTRAIRRLTPDGPGRTPHESWSAKTVGQVVGTCSVSTRGRG